MHSRTTSTSTALPEDRSRQFLPDLSDLTQPDADSPAVVTWANLLHREPIFAAIDIDGQHRDTEELCLFQDDVRWEIPRWLAGQERR